MRLHEECGPMCVCRRIAALKRREFIESMASIRLYRAAMEERVKPDSVMDSLTPDALRKHLGFPPAPPTSNYDLVELQKMIDAEWRRNRIVYQAEGEIREIG